MKNKKIIFDVVDREIIKNILQQEKIDWYFFHEKYKLSPGQLSRSIKKLENCKFIIVDNEKIQITEEGRKTIIAKRNSILRKSQDEYWGIVQEDRKGNKVEINQYYLPNKAKIKK
jgi:DNA-binding PadR family transcriptional regulator